MVPSIEKITKFFQLEKEKNYQNRAVIGGLDKILGNWIFEARKDHLPEALITSIKTGLENYASISPESRKDLLDELLVEIQKIDIKETPPGKPSSSIPSEKKPQDLQVQKTPSPSPRPVVERHHTAQPREFLGLNAPLTVIQGIGPKVAESYQSVGLHTLNDMLYYFPRRYDDYSQLKPINRVNFGDELTIIATVQSCSVVSQKHNQMARIEVVVSDTTDYMRLVFFRRGLDIAQYYENRFRHGLQLVISGKVTAYLGRKQMVEPEYENLEKVHLNTNGIIPVYPLTSRLTQNSLRNTIHQVITFYAPKVPDFLPDSIKRSSNLIDLPIALQNIHYPTNQELLKSSRERLAFDEIFLLQLGVLQQKRNWQSGPAVTYEFSDEKLDSFYTTLPYSLTNAQIKTISEIRKDLSSGHPMNRLLQGDVGSGKTIVAAIAMLIVASAGAQCALMAPTGILAEQHYRTLSNLLTSDQFTDHLQPEEIALLTGDTPEAEKKEIVSRLANGEIKVIIGTHALIEEKIELKNLQFVVIDEQHRFGVNQRSALRQKGETPHLLVMTATPIPRSLALTLYGDLDLSLMDEMPAGRQPIETHILSPLERERAYQLIRSQVDRGSQAFIVYPLIENSEDSEVKAAVSEHDHLQQEIFPEYKIGLLHGRMKADEKEKIMRQFRDQEFQILVSTTVIEVGVDIPNATVMLVEGADRFGLAQLHQLRGRVGRGDKNSFCLLIPTSDNATENERLSAMTETNDGFVLAEKDLSQRGPGDFIGTRQSGFAELQLASITDIRLIEKARSQAESVYEIDPDLSSPEHSLLAEKLASFWKQNNSDIS